MYAVNPFYSLPTKTYIGVTYMRVSNEAPHVPQ